MLSSSKVCSGVLAFVCLAACLGSSKAIGGVPTIADCLEQLPPRLRPWCTTLLYQQPLFADEFYPSTFQGRNIGREGVRDIGSVLDNSVLPVPPKRQQDADHVLLRFGRRR